MLETGRGKGGRINRQSTEDLQGSEILYDIMMMGVCIIHLSKPMVFMHTTKSET